MTPTNELRFVGRTVPAPEVGYGITKTVRILQQKWVKEAMTVETYGENWKHIPATYEWRDVPVEKEQP